MRPSPQSVPTAKPPKTSMTAFEKLPPPPEETTTGAGWYWEGITVPTPNSAPNREVGYSLMGPRGSVGFIGARGGGAPGFERDQRASQEFMSVSFYLVRSMSRTRMVAAPMNPITMSQQVTGSKVVLFEGCHGQAREAIRRRADRGMRISHQSKLLR